MLIKGNAKSEKPWYQYPPNILTVFRFVLTVPMAVLYLKDMRIASLCVYLLASLTDLVDGFIARKYDMISTIGKVLDPLADKVMLLTVIACMYAKGDLPLLLITLVFGKELLMIMGGILLYGKGRLVVPANSVGKAATVVFFVAVLLTFLKDYTAPVNLVFMYVAAAFSVFSLVQYAYLILKQLRQGGMTS